MLSRCIVAFCAGTLPLIGPCQAIAAPPLNNAKLEIISDQAVHEDGSDYLTEAIVDQAAGFGFQVTNVGDDTMLLEAPELGGPQADQYVIGDLPSTLESGQTAILGVTFKPTSTGPKIGSITIRTSASNAPEFLLILKGIGLPEPVAVMQVRDLDTDNVLPNNGTYDFGTLLVGDVVAATMSAESIGTDTVKVFSIDIEGDLAGDVLVEGGHVNIEPQDEHKFVLTYEPTTPGLKLGEVVINNTSQNNPYVISLRADVKADCNFDGVADDEKIEANPELDCDEDGKLDECEEDTDDDGVIDDCDRCPGEDDTEDLDGDGVADCLQEFFEDCNLNGKDDAEEVATGDAEDCNQNGSPDDCETDSDNDGVIDDCDRCPGEDDRADFNANGTPDCLEQNDEPQFDCNFNGKEDAEEVATGDAEDCNQNGTPDLCETDSDSDDVIDDCDRCPEEDDLLDLDLNGIADCIERNPDGEAPNCGAGGCGSGMMMPLMLGLMSVGFRRPRRRRRS